MYTTIDIFCGPPAMSDTCPPTTMVPTVQHSDVEPSSEHESDGEALSNVNLGTHVDETAISTSFTGVVIEACQHDHFFSPPPV